MLAAARMSRLRSILADLHPVQRTAIAVWAAMVLAVTLRVAVAQKSAGSVFPVYRTAAAAWVEGTDLYTLDFSKPCFRYHPLIAAAFVPANILPEKAAAILWRWLGVALALSGLVLWQRHFMRASSSPSQQGWLPLLAAPLVLQSLNNAQANPHLIGLLLLAMVAAKRDRWTLAAALLAIATVLKLYPIAIGLLMVLALPRAFAWRYGALLAGACLLPFALQRPDYVAAQYRLWVEYLFVDARHAAAIEQAPRDLFLFVRFWWGSPPEWLYRPVQLGAAGLIAAYIWNATARPLASLPRKRGEHLNPPPAYAGGSPRGRGRGSLATLPVVLHLGCLWMTLLGPSTESCTYTLLGPTAAIVLVTAANTSSRWIFGLALAGYGLLILPVIAAIFPGGTQLQHWGPQPAGALLLGAAVVIWISPVFSRAPCCRGRHFP